MKKTLSEYTVEELNEQAKIRLALFLVFAGAVSFAVGVSIYGLVHNKTNVAVYLPLLSILWLPINWNYYASVVKELKKRSAY